MRSLIIIDVPNQPVFLEEFGEYDIRSPDHLIEYLLNLYSKPGDLILDPFAGLGTTLFVAERMNRIPYGIAFGLQKFKYIQSNLVEKFKSHIFHGDTRKIDSFSIPKISFCYTSPPYMRFFDEENPLSDYELPGTYEQYLSELTQVFEKLYPILAVDAYLVVELENIPNEKGFTTLAWDMGQRIREIFELKDELIVGYNPVIPVDSSKKFDFSPEPRLDHAYCLIFQKK